MVIMGELGRLGILGIGIINFLSMLTLYIKNGCQYCAKVLSVGEELGLEFNLKNVADEAIALELVTRGGRKQMPYLVDGDTGTEMYESDAIIAYLREKVAKH